MPTYSKSLVIFTLFAVLWLENKAHHCGSPHEKTHKECNKKTTSAATPIKVNQKCNTTTLLSSCQCGPDYDFLYYPVPKSGNCNDVFKRLSTTPTDYHFREENCHKVHRAVCSVDSYCWKLDFAFIDKKQTDPTAEEFITLAPTPKEFVFAQNASEPFCTCGFDDHYPMPKSGNCTDLEKTYRRAGNRRAGNKACSKAQTFCRDTCNCNAYYVDPTECNPQTCNNATEAFCTCDINGNDNHYPVPKSGDCMDVLKQFSTTQAYYYYRGVPCYKTRKVCKCTTSQTTHCVCNDECVSGCD